MYILNPLEYIYRFINIDRVKQTSSFSILKSGGENIVKN